MNAAHERTRSLWMEAAVAKARALDGDERADVVIVGSGIAGLSTAYELAVAGRKVIVLDRGQIGQGMTARTTAHLAFALDDYYANLISARDLETARQAYQSQAHAISRIEAIAAKERIDCDFQRVDGYLFLAPGTPASDLDREFEACKQVGVPVFDVRERTPLHAESLVRSLRFPDQARFHPLKYLAGLVRAIKKHGGLVFANTTVESVEEQKTQVVAKTDKGTVRAADVVIATNSPISGNTSIHAKQAPYRTYAIAATLPRGSLPDTLYWDTLDPYHYVRLQPHSQRTDIVIIGGEDHKSGTTDDGAARFAALERWARERLPKMGKVTHCWSGQVMEPVDYLGFNGRNSGDKHRYLVTGDSGQGITNGVLASILIANQILKGESAWEEAYDPGRATTGNIAEFVGETMTAVSSLGEYLTAGESASIKELKPGQGGVFRSGLKNIAACRDQDGQLHLHSASCTHMGCVVHWNSLEQCWDCPCHGSHFAPDGAVLNAPAVTPLGDVEEKEKRVAAE